MFRATGNTGTDALGTRSRDSVAWTDVVVAIYGFGNWRAVLRFAASAAGTLIAPAHQKGQPFAPRFGATPLTTHELR